MSISYHVHNLSAEESYFKLSQNWIFILQWSLAREWLSSNFVWNKDEIRNNALGKIFIAVFIPDDHKNLIKIQLLKVMVKIGFIEIQHNFVKITRMAISVARSQNTVRTSKTFFSHTFQKSILSQITFIRE